MREKLHFPRFWQGIGWLMVAVVCWLSLTPNPPEPPGLLGWDKAQHLLAYGGLMFWFRQVFHRHWRWPAFLTGLGMMLEFLQGFTGARTPDLFDVIANTMGVLLGVVLAELLAVLRIEHVDHLMWASCSKENRGS
jgi:VanZ family protein